MRIVCKFDTGEKVRYSKLKKRESYLVSRISKEDSKAHKRIGYTRYEIREW